MYGWSVTQEYRLLFAVPAIQLQLPRSWNWSAEQWTHVPIFEVAYSPHYWPVRFTPIALGDRRFSFQQVADHSQHVTCTSQRRKLSRLCRHTSWQYIWWLQLGLQLSVAPVVKTAGYDGRRAITKATDFICKCCAAPVVALSFVVFICRYMFWGLSSNTSCVTL